jgi:hypothetical protein
MTLRFARLAAAALAAPIVLSGCSVFQKKTLPPCPPIYILADASTLTKYRPGPGRDLTDVEAEAEIVGFKGNCSYDANGAEVTIQVSVDAKRGPANASRKATLPYFVAIPYFYPKPEAKAVFPLTVEFPEGVSDVRVTDEEVTLRIPVKDQEIIDKYEIFLGFQETEEELEHNRRLRR